MTGKDSTSKRTTASGGKPGGKQPRDDKISVGSVGNDSVGSVGIGSVGSVGDNAVGGKDNTDNNNATKSDTKFTSCNVSGREDPVVPVVPVGSVGEVGDRSVGSVGDRSVGSVGHNSVGGFNNHNNNNKPTNKK